MAQGIRCLCLVLVAAILVSSVWSIGILASSDGKPGRPRWVNIILMIGDGMGTGQVTAARASVNSDQRLHIDRLRHGGLITTHSYDDLVTDSAAAATALATGFKTRNGMISIGPGGEELSTILEYAESLGMDTGLVTTTRMTHATPAAFASHVVSRGMENEIAVQLTYSGTDVLLGGGRRHFLPEGRPDSARGDDRDLIQEAEELGYAYVENRGELLSMAGRSGKLLGLFAVSHMSFDRLRDESLEPSLAEMTEVAIGILSSNRRGFFLMVEGGRIDHAGHANNMDDTVGDMLAFDLAIRAALDFARASQRTLLVVTADHETGGLSVMPTSIGEGINIFWATGGHTGNMVPIYSEGVFASLFAGTLDNTDVGENLLEILGGKEKEQGARGLPAPLQVLSLEARHKQSHLGR